MTQHVLVVDDDAVIREVSAEALRGEYRVATAMDTVSGALALTAEMPDVLVADVRMPGGGGLELVRRALSRFPDLAVVVMTGYGTAEDFVQFHRMGIADYLKKPFTPTDLRRSVLRALETRRLRSENATLRTALAPTGPHDQLVGESPAMVALREQVVRVAPTDATVLVTGASGTGKEVVARLLHALSRRAAGPFVPVHCGALPRELLDSELFGHVKGAFTGADRTRAGRFEEAEGGTLFLDEVGTMGEATQVRLLRVLAGRELTRVGESSPRRTDVRIVAATNASLETLVSQGRFREDLYYRLAVFPLAVPPLIDRRSDIPVLAGQLLRRCCERLGRPPMALSQEALRRLVAHSWPGNVRELENSLEHAVIVAGGARIIEAPDLLLPRPRESASPTWALPADGIDLPGLLERLERELILQSLERTGQRKQAAADLLGLQRTTLVQKLRKIQRPGAE